MTDDDYDYRADALAAEHAKRLRAQWSDRIDVEYVCPPIPLRCCDYRATLKDYDEGDAQGWGRTRDDAMDDLIRQIEEDDE